MRRLQVYTVVTVTEHCYVNYPTCTRLRSGTPQPLNQMETSKNLSQTYVWQPNTTSLGNSEPIDDLLFVDDDLDSLAGELQ